MRGRRQRLLPKPPAPPEGYMWLYWQLVPIEEAEERAKIIMDDFDQLPRGKRDQQNYRPQRARPPWKERGLTARALAARPRCIEDD
jgi:hypothetical protein